MMQPPVVEGAAPTAWRSLVAPYQSPSVGASAWQLVNTYVPYLALQALMLWSVKSPGGSPWLTVALGLVTAGFLTRSFIIFHDCGHGSFFRSRRANDVVGFVTGVLTWTPSYKWWKDHATHHATSANLDRRGVGDVDVLTVDEYRAASPARRLGYRVLRNPLFLFGVAGLFVFVVEHRFWGRGATRRVKLGVLATDAVLLAVAASYITLFGWKAWLLAQLLPVYFTTVLGFWLFYVQHHFEDVYWARDGQWSFFDASMRGSSYYKLPRVLQWFTGNIGFHHVHHLSSKIPNYRLQACHDDNPALQRVPTLTLATAMSCLKVRLYDEARGTMVGFDAAA